VAHDAAADLAFGAALVRASGDVVARFGVVEHAVGGDRPQRAGALAVAAPVEAMAAVSGPNRVTIRPTGRCAPGTARPGRQLNASARNAAKS
jgi:hypothetical protein